MSRPRGIHLSGTQVIAGVLATLTGAIAASYLGVAGTLIGAALGSIASTMGTEVYRHYLLRSQEGLRSAGEMLYHRTTGTHTATQPTATQPTATQRAETPDHATYATGVTQPSEAGAAASGRHAAPADPASTQLIPELAALRRNGSPARWAGGGDRDGGGPGETAGTRAGGQVGDGETGSGSPVAGPGRRGGHWWDGISRRQWLTYGGVTVGAFVVVIAAITIFELSVGKPVNAVVWNQHGTGTSVGNLVTGGHSSPRRVTHPATTGTPSAQPSSSAPQSPAGSVAPSSPGPTPSTSAPVTPAPTPTTSGTPGGSHSIPPASSSP